MTEYSKLKENLDVSKTTIEEVHKQLEKIKQRKNLYKKKRSEHENHRTI